MDDRKSKSLKNTGLDFEVAVTKIQKMMDPKSVVTHNEKLKDRVGNVRQYDAVIRGKFGGMPVLGVVECKDYKIKVGPSKIEAFSKKTENLGANLKLLVSRKGFTKQALQLAQHENIGCYSLLPDNPEQAGFSVGNLWYGIIRLWKNMKLFIGFEEGTSPISDFNPDTVKWRGKKVVNWFLKELYNKYSEVSEEKTYNFKVIFNHTRNIEIEGQLYPVKGLSMNADRVYKKKKKWVYWTGEAYYDWNEKKFIIPPKGIIWGNSIEGDLNKWDDHNGEIPDFENTVKPSEGISMNFTVYNEQKWDSSLDEEVPHLEKL